MTILKILLADDQANVKKFTHLQEILGRAFGGIHKDLQVSVKKVHLLSDAKVILDDVENLLDLVLIDIYWTRGGRPIDPFGPSSDLLKLSLARKETVSVALSGEEGALTQILYDPARKETRPHAAMHKEFLISERLVAAVLVKAFSVARIPIRSRAAEVDWTNLSELSSDVDPTVVGELACMTVPSATKVTLTSIGGGQSGAVTVLARVQRSDSDDGPRYTLLKLERDERRLASEQSAHEALVKLWPANTFAAIGAYGLLEFAGWSGIGFDAVDGVTLSSRAGLMLEERDWDLVVPDSILNKWVELAERTVKMAPASMVASEFGSLGASRMERVRQAAKELRLGEDEQGALNSYAKLFGERARTFPVTIAHGDLHTRNILLDTSGRSIWVDAASMRRRSFWASDLARLFAWYACESAETGSELQEIGRALMVDGSAPVSTWGQALRRKLESSLSVLGAGWQEDGEWAVDVERDWLLAVGVELLRIGYSRVSFGSFVRREALQLGIKSIGISAT